MHKIEPVFVFMELEMADMNWKKHRRRILISCDRSYEGKLRGWWESIKGGIAYMTLDKGNLFEEIDI